MTSSTTMRRLRLVVAAVAVVAVLAVLAAAGAVVWTVRRSFPQLDGELVVPGLTGRVSVVRDAQGVPQLYADTADDLLFAQGFVHAQDRFYEMDFRRHVTAGRLAELLGEDAVESDVFLRTLGWHQVAEEELARVSPQTRRYLEAYAAGVNAWMAGRSGAELSLEYAVLGARLPGYVPEPWSPVDSLAWLKAMAWDLRGNISQEIDRARLSAELDSSRVEQLYPGYPYGEHRPIVTEGAVEQGRYDQEAAPLAALPASARESLAELAETVDGLPSLLGENGNGIGSNSWVVGGRYTGSGKPLLANDPHLAPQMPSVWYQMGLHCRTPGEECPFQVAGYTFAGLPGVVIGHNARIAWGFTNLGADVSDLYLEKVTGDTYEYQGEQVPVVTREETIRVAGGEDRVITVRSTRHGPIVSDAYADAAQVGREAPVVDGAPDRRGLDGRDGEGYAVALRWTALDPGNTADAVFALNAADNWQEFRAAAALFAVPAQNLVYADVDGNIGYQAPGRVPVRRSGDGRWPVPGWTDAYEWTGEVPFEALPSVYNPEDGYVVTANNAVAGQSYPYHLTDDWDQGYRSQRIHALLREAFAAGKVDAETMSAIQDDDLNPMAAALAPRLLEIEVDEFVRPARELLRGWDGRQHADSAPAAYFNAVWRHLLARTFHDELPEGSRPDGSDRWFAVVTPLLEDPDDPWWDDVRTSQRETRDDVLRAAMIDARYELTAKLSKDPAKWRWGQLHRFTLTNQSLGTSGIDLVERLFNRGPVEVGGGSGVVDATGWNASRGYAADWVPSMRMVVDLADLDSSRWVNLTGASGHAFHPNYADQTRTWAEGGTYPWRFTESRINGEAEHVLTLVPSGPPFEPTGTGTAPAGAGGNAPADRSGPGTATPSPDGTGAGSESGSESDGG